VADKDYLIAGACASGISGAVLSTDPSVDLTGFSDDTVRENLIVCLSTVQAVQLSYPLRAGETVFLFPTGSGEVNVFLADLPAETTVFL